MLVIPYVAVILYILFIKKTDKLTWLLAASIMVLLSVTSNDYADLINYEPLFEYVNNVEFSIAIQTTGIGWGSINKLFYAIGLNYRGLVVAMLIVNYYIMHIAIKKIRTNENLYFGLFLIFPALIQLVQFKFFTAFCVVLLGYSVLLTSDRFSNVKFIAVVAIASTIHTSSLVFLVFLLVKRKHYNRNLFFVIAGMLALIMLMFMGRIVSIASLFIDSRLVDRYMVNSISPSSISWIVTIFLVWLLSFAVSKFLLSNKDFSLSKYSLLPIKSRTIDYCGMSIEILLLTLPFLLLDRNFHRFLEIGYSLLFVIAGWYIAPPKFSRDRLIFVFVIIACLVIISLIYCPYDTVLKPIFTFDRFVEIRR